MVSTKMKRSRRFLLGFAFGVSLGVVTLFAIMELIPSEINPETASSFFFAATGVNATLLVAISVTISSILTRTPEKQRKTRTLFFMAQLVVVFIGMIISGVGILVFNPAVPLDYQRFVDYVDIVFTSWVVGFVLLIAGIWVSILPEENMK
jgi:hypothetical protein